MTHSAMAAIGGMRPATQFAMELYDSRSHRCRGELLDAVA